MIYGQIEHNIPMPLRGTLKYNWPGLEVGDSILVPSRAAGVAGQLWAKRNGCKVVVHKMQTQPFGYRVWRVE